MGAWFSSTDDGDDRSGIRFSGVFGQLDKPTPATIWRFNYLTKKIPAKLEDIFEAAPQEVIEVPKEWMTRLTVTAPVLTYKGKGRRKHYSPVEYPVTGPQSSTYPPSTPTVGHTRGSSEERNYGRGRDKSFSRHDFYEIGSPDDGEFWGFGGGHAPGSDESLGEMMRREHASLYGQDAASQAERRMAWESMLSDVEERAHETSGDAGDVREIRMQHVGDDEAPVGVSYSLHDDLTHHYGGKVADAYFDIDNVVHDLEGQDELLGTLASDMVGLMTDDEQKLALMRQLYNNLGSAAQEKLQTHGL